MSQIQKTDSQVAISSIGTSIIENLELTPYEARISRERPGCFVIMIDQSGSMSKGWGLNSEKSKAKLVATYVNAAINDIINICQKSEPEPRDYFEIAVIGYGADSEKAKKVWEGALAQKIFVTPAELKKNPTGLEGEIEVERKTFKGIKLVKIPVFFWFSPVAKSLTPMGSGLDLCTEILTNWTKKYPNSFPPIVMNITNGEQTDCKDEELLEKAYNLKQTKTLYGNTLLFNIHISDSNQASVIFPEREDELPDDKNSKLLYNMSSTLPDAFKKRVAREIKKTDLKENTNYVAMTFQASVSDLTKSLDIGTKTVQP